MAQVRRAKGVWSGDLATGSGTVSAATTTTFKDLEVSWGSRTEEPQGRTSPEELLAAAHASCFSMALAARLGRAGSPPQKLEVTASVTFDKVEAGWAVTATELAVKGWVSGCEAERFSELADDAGKNCPISQALRGNVRMTVAAELAA
ncbi:OsmC family protein [soil metagenome]